MKYLLLFYRIYRYNRNYGRSIWLSLRYAYVNLMIAKGWLK